MANSFRKMAHGKDAIIRRTDRGMFMQLSNIHVKPGFNCRDEDDPRNVEADEELFQYLMNGGTVPPLECIPRDDGGVWIVEGHRRNKAFRRCVEAGRQIKDVHIVPFEGDDVKQKARVMTSNNQLTLSQVEQSKLVRDLANMNLTVQEIAAEVSKSIPTVELLLQLSLADRSIKKQVSAGKVSPAVVVDRMKEFGEGAAEQIEKDIKQAEEKGVKKVTKRIAKPEISAKRARELVEIIAKAGIDDDGTIKLDGLELINAMAIIADHTGIKDNR